MRNGLIPGGLRGSNSRSHVHFYRSQSLEDAKNFPSKYELGIWIDLPRAVHDGVIFHENVNRTILSRGNAGCVSSHYIIRVQDLHSKQILYSC